MKLEELLAGVDERTLGKELFDCVADLYPICRSITGEGVRETLARLARLVPLSVHEVPSGTTAFDWTVPNEWNIRDAYVKDIHGQRVVDFQRSNLHVVSYSAPICRRMPLSELRPHLHALPDRPDWIPYRTTYYTDGWGFCVSQRQLDALPDGDYDVCIDASLRPGSLTYGEAYVRGASEEEVLISCHVCHPSLANDNLSGVAIAAHLARRLRDVSPRYSYRFLFVPATIGPIVWLARNESIVPVIRYGLVLAGLGDAGRLTYKKSRRGDTSIDRAATRVLRRLGEPKVLEFSPDGYDERQYGSPGFDLAVGRLSRTPYGDYPEYHTSADNLEFVKPAQLAASLAACLEIFSALEGDRRYVNTCPKGEPQLGKRGLYHAMGGSPQSPASERAMLWVLNLSDGRYGLLDIAERSGLGFEDIERAATVLHAHGLLKVAP
ncbi:MAG: DUF4910 domain-containing protein [Betaproteobacteria bacterium]